MTAAINRRFIDAIGEVVRVPCGVAAGAKIKRGWLVGKNAGGYLVPFTATTGLSSAGIADADYDNTGGADGAATINVQTGVFDLEIATAGDAVTNADAPCAVYGLDNQTIAKTSGTSTRSIAGLLIGVWSGEVVSGVSPPTRAKVYVGPVAHAIAAGLLS